MKKTQSLKLMLLGLMASVSTSALAAVGDVFDYGSGAGSYLFYEELADGNAKVIGIKSIGTAGTIIIPTTCENSWTGGTSLNVVAVDDDWAGKTKVVVTHYDVNGNVIGTPVEKETFDLNDLEDPITLQIDAKYLTQINTDALFTLNPWIEKFVVSAGAGLANIPDYAFINGKKTIVQDDEAIAKKEDEIKALKASIANSQECIVKEGKYNGTNEKYQGYQVYKLLYNSQNVDVPVDDPKYVIIDQTANPVADGNKQNYPLLVITAAGDVQSAGGATARVNKSGNLVRSINNTVTVVGNPVAEDAEECLVGEITKLGLQQTKQNAETALQNAQAAVLAYEQTTQTNLTKTRDEEKAEYDAAKKLQDKLLNDANLNYAWNHASSKVWQAIRGEIDPTTLVDGANADEGLDRTWYGLIYKALVTSGWPLKYKDNGEAYQNPYRFDILGTFDVNDKVIATYKDYQDAQKALDKSLAEVKQPLLDDLAEKQEAFDKAKKAYDDAVAALNKAQGELDTLNEGAPVYTVEGENTVLKNVEWNNEKIKYFGNYSFYNCTAVPVSSFTNQKADKNGVFPKGTETIGDFAFTNTNIDAKLSRTHETIKKIGDYAFANTQTVNINLTDATLLVDDAIGEGVWNGDGIVAINLLNTQLTQMPNGLAENIKRTDAVTDCDGNYIGKPVDGKLKSYKTDEIDLTKEEDVAKLYLANNTLTTVVMPKASDKIRAFNFAFCKKLNSITIPATVESIGVYALAGTAMTEFNLTALTKLAALGDGAFAYNPNLKTVRFAPEAPFKSIEGESFACDAALTTIELNEDVECLAEGLFADSKVAVLDLSKTKITVLRNLFLATKEHANETLTDIILPDLTYEKDATGAYVLDENGEYKVKTPGVQIIMDGALSFLHKLVGHALTAEDLAALDQLTTEQKALPAVFIPSSVIVMRPNVFYGDQSLQSVIALNSKLTNLGDNTFANCPSLKVFVFITDQPIQPQWTVAPYAWMRPVEPIITPQDPDGSLDPIVNPGGDGDDVVVVPPFDDCGDESWATFSPDWFNFKDEQFALLDGSRNRVEVYVTEESYYSIKGDTWNSAEQNYSHLNKWQFVMTLTKYPDGKYYKSFVDFNFGTWIPQDQARVYTAYQDGNEIYAYGAKHNGNYYKIPAAGPSTYIEYDEETGQFDRSKVIGSAAVIIRSNNPTITYKRVSLPGDKVQSGLDMLNELRVIKKDAKIYDEDNIWWFNFKNSTSEYGFFQIKGDIKAGRVVFPTADWQGMGYPSRINVTFIDDELTGIMGVKEYLETLKNKGAIYNLQGVKVTAPVKGQMYIQNGKKFIQK